MEKIIIGLVGEIASGKDTVANYLSKKYKSQTISFSASLRDILDRIFIPHTRVNFANLGIKLRELFGNDLLSKVVAQEIKNSKKKLFCLPNIRLSSDIEHLKKEPGFVLVAIETDKKTRYNRLIKRNQNTDDKSKTWTQFQKDAYLPTEIEIKNLMKTAKYTIDNNGGYKTLYRQVDEIIDKLKI